MPCRSGSLSHQALENNRSPESTVILAASQGMSTVEAGLMMMEKWKRT
jgi:hypothetical protein